MGLRSENDDDAFREPDRKGGVSKRQPHSIRRLKTFLRGPALSALVLFLTCLLVAACGSDVKRVTGAEQKALEAKALAPPQLQAGERIHVTVYGEPTLSGDFQIDPSGLVSLPLAGTIKAAGLTQQEFERDLEQRLSSTDYIKKPKITVSIAEFRPFYILGEVEKPGSYPYMGGLNVLSAIALAGGRTYRANQDRILIQHPGETTMREYDLSTPIPVLPGDIIQVPRRYF